MPRALKFVAGFVIHGLTIAVVLSVFLFWWIAQEFQKPGPLREVKLFQIERGEGLRMISQNLATEGIIENPLIFMISSKILGMQAGLKAGEYEFTPDMSARDVMYKIHRGDIVERRVTFREGLTSHEIVTLLKGVEELTGEIPDAPAEGTLLPQTYDYRKGETRQQILDRMAQAMQKTLNALWEKRAADSPLKTEQEALTLASIIEKETGTPEERKRVAGVFINRLKAGMPLQTDPTVIYAITKGKHRNEGQGPLGRRLLSKDLDIDSPYNTYKNAGLPPGPICNPGEASLEAALQPEHHDYLYFVADGTGGHVFAKTLTEHNRNVAAWRKIRKTKN